MARSVSQPEPGDEDDHWKKYQSGGEIFFSLDAASRCIQQIQPNQGKAKQALNKYKYTLSKTKKKTLEVDHGSEIMTCSAYFINHLETWRIRTGQVKDVS
jgi:hypothetical protein